MYSKGILFDESFVKQLKEKFYHVDQDPEHGERLFFDNSGGSLRLKKCVEKKAEFDAFPDCPERIHARSVFLKGLVEEGTRQILEIIFGAKSGALITELTASQTMFQAVGMIMENVAGNNAVVSSIEHPSAFDAVEYYCKKTGREMRVVPANTKTGGIDVEEVVKRVDENTVLVSIMSASNISGNIMDIKEISRRVKEINPNVFVVSDMVQHAPHCKIDVEDMGVDVANIAPYKFFGIRGCGYCYVSDRVVKFPHHKLIAKSQETFELGTSAPANFSAMMEIINYVCYIGEHFIGKKTRKETYDEGMRRIHLQERALLYRMLEGTPEVKGLRYIKGVKVYVDTDDITSRDLIVAMGIDGVDFTESVAEYQRRGVTVYERVNTSIYSKRIVEALGIQGAIRVSPMHCHSAEDIDKYLKITAEMAEYYGRS